MATSTSAQPMMPTKTRPAGVTILGVLSILGGIVLFFGGIILLIGSAVLGFSAIFTGPSGLGLSALGWGLLVLIFGILTLAIGVGLLRLRMWALILGAIIYLAFFAIQLIPLAQGHSLSLFNWVVAIFWLFLFFYLIVVRKHFT